MEVSHCAGAGVRLSAAESDSRYRNVTIDLGTRGYSHRST